MDGAPCRSLRAQPCSSPNDRDNIWRSFTPIPRSMDARPLSSTYNDSSQSPRQPSTRWCSSWNVGDCSAALPDSPAVSKFSLPPRTSLSCDEHQNSIDHYPCAEVLVHSPTAAVPRSAARRPVSSQSKAIALPGPDDPGNCHPTRVTEFITAQESSATCRCTWSRKSQSTAASKTFRFLSTNNGTAPPCEFGVCHDPWQSTFRIRDAFRSRSTR